MADKRESYRIKFQTKKILHDSRGTLHHLLTKDVIQGLSPRRQTLLLSYILYGAQ